MKPVAESSKAADTERFEREVGVWKPPKEKGGISAAQSTHPVVGNQPNDPNSTTKGNKMNFNHVSQNVKSLVAKLNKHIRSCEHNTDYDTIRATLALRAERYAAENLGTTLEALDPQLAALLGRIRDARGALTGDDAFQLVDYGIAALDLRAPEDR